MHGGWRFLGRGGQLPLRGKPGIGRAGQRPPTQLALLDRHSRVPRPTGDHDAAPARPRRIAGARLLCACCQFASSRLSSAENAALQHISAQTRTEKKVGAP